MKFTTILAAALSLALLSACDRGEPRPKTTGTTGATGSSAAPRNEASSATQTTPANIGAPSKAEQRESDSPQQQQVDPKESAQHNDFKHPATGGK